MGNRRKMNKAVSERIQEKMSCEPQMPHRPVGTWFKSLEWEELQGAGWGQAGSFQVSALLCLCLTKCSERVRDKRAKSKTQPGSGEAALDFLSHSGRRKAIIFGV